MAQRQLTEIEDEAADLMASQQAMPDEGVLRRLRLLVREAYEAGRTVARWS